MLLSEQVEENMGNISESLWTILGMTWEGQEDLLGFSSEPAVDIASLVVPAVEDPYLDTSECLLKCRDAPFLCHTIRIGHRES